eukprot:4215931-Lingulodinium_polyedra.AAC.1
MASSCGYAASEVSMSTPSPAKKVRKLSQKKAEMALQVLEKSFLLAQQERDIAAIVAKLREDPTKIVKVQAFMETSLCQGK